MATGGVEWRDLTAGVRVSVERLLDLDQIEQLNQGKVTPEIAQLIHKIAASRKEQQDAAQRRWQASSNLKQTPTDIP